MSNKQEIEERLLKPHSGMLVLILNSVLMLGSLGGIIISLSQETNTYLVLLLISILYFVILGPILYAGLKVLKPKEALVLTFFGKYYGTLKGEGFFFVNPFTNSLNPASMNATTANFSENPTTAALAQTGMNLIRNKKISLKIMTLNNEKQKINDQLGNPIIIGIVVIWRVVNTAKAVFNVENYKEYLSIQCDAALRNIVRLYPYDVSDSQANDNEKSLRGSSQEVAERLVKEIQSKVEIAGIEILEARITHLSYAPEIAAVMLQRQQATAIVDAKQKIVEGAVGMVDMALTELSDKSIVKLTEERKAELVSNLLVVLCSNRDVQPVVNTANQGS